MKKNNLFILLLLSYFANGQPQQPRISYIFKVENPDRYKFDTLLYDGIMYEFSCERIYIKDDIFVEKNFLHLTDTFKVGKDVWKIKKGEEWNNFFVPKLFETKTPIKWGIFFLIPKEKMMEDNIEFYTYYLSLEDHINLSNSCALPVVVYFTPIEGITKVDYHSFKLKRIKVE